MKDSRVLIPLEIKQNFHFTFLMAICWTVMSAATIVNSQDVIKWSHLNLNAIFLILFIWGFITACILQWIEVFDRRPILKFNVDGFWKRSAYLPFIKVKFYPWSDVQSFFLLEQSTRSGKSRVIIIRKKSSDETIKLDADGLEAPYQKIVEILDVYAKEFGFYDLGVETR